MNNKEISLMYSGGLDTTYTAMELARQFNKVHLLTFCNGFCIRLKASQRHVYMLQERFGEDKFVHSIAVISDIFSLLKKDLIRSMFRYRTPLLFDLCCKLSMEVATIYYCLENKIEYATDGNNPFTQGEIFMQQREYLNLVSELFADFGIKYLHPYKHLSSRREVSEKLKSSGINTEVKFLGKIGITTQLLTQPFCLWAPVPFFFTSRLRHIPFIRFFNLSTEKAIEFRLKKIKIARDFIDYLRLNSSAARIYPCKRENLDKFFKVKSSIGHESSINQTARD